MEVYLQIFNEFVKQLTDDDLTTGYYQQDGETRHTSNASMWEIERFFFQDRIISKKLWPPTSPNLTAADFFLWGLLKGTVYKNTPRTIEQLKRRYMPRDSSHQRHHFKEKYSRIWRNAFKCARKWKETSFSIDYEQVLFCIAPGMCT